MALIPISAGKVTPDEFAQAVASKLGTSTDEAKTTLESIAEVIEDSLLSRRAVEFRDLATFRLEVEAERKVRVIETGQLETVPARIYPRAQFSEKVKSAVEQMKVTPEELKLAEEERQVDHRDHRN